MILIAKLALIKALRAETWYSRGYKRSVICLRHFIGMEDAAEHKMA